MKREYNRKFAITYSDIGSSFCVDAFNAFKLIQNIMTEYFGYLGSDNYVLKHNDNAIWVITKTKVHFDKMPTWRQEIIGTGITTKIKPIRVEAESVFKDLEENVLFSAKQEYCVIDLPTRTIKKISDISYPKDMEAEETTLDVPFLKLSSEFKDEDFVEEYIVRASDIDYSQHTNNAVYIRIVLDTFSSSFLENHTITDIEVHHINESKEGQTLKVYRIQNENEIEFLIKENDREIVRVHILIK